MTRNNPLYADITVGIQSALPRRPREAADEEDSRNQDRMGVSSGRPEPAKGTSFRGMLSTAQSSQLYAFGPFS